MIYFYASVHDISSYIEKKYGLFVQMFCIKFQLLKMLSIFLANQSCLSKLYFELWDNKESSKETVVAIYEVIYKEHCKNTLRIEGIELSTRNHLIALGDMH